MAEADRNDGRRLETKFADWLRASRRFDQVLLREMVKGEHSAQPYEVDVKGTRHRGCLMILWAPVGIIGTIVMMVSVVVMVNKLRVPPWWCFALLATFFVMMIAGQKYGTVEVWAECKDVKDGVTREHVGVLKQKVDEVRAKQTGWKPTHIYVVSSNRFQPDALRLAYSHDFECLRETADGFERVEPNTWNA